MTEKKALVQAIVDRLKDVVGVTKDVELAEALGASRSTPAVWKIRDRIPFAECMTVAEKYGVSLDWLVLGRGTPGIEEPELTLHPVVDNDALASVEFPAFDMPSFLDADSPQQSISLPAAWIEQQRVDPAEVIAMRYAGNNLAPTVNDGDVMLIDRRPRDIDGLFVVRLGDCIRGKRVQRMQGGALHLLNDNPNYQTEVIEADQIEAVEFIGYCFGVLRYVR
ncbi:LexA family transcriptional regulator [Paraburkholderia sediminicola]|uniref:LexA family transcriptional regulator n=1 Tax=Paraburkholderia sediminicola TaxID=458836 RepID=UPI0038B8C7C9